MYNPIDGDVGALFPPRRGGGPIAPIRNNRAGMIGPLPDQAVSRLQPPAPPASGGVPGGMGWGQQPGYSPSGGVGAESAPNQPLLNGRDALLQALSDRVRRMGGGGVV